MSLLRKIRIGIFYRCAKRLHVFYKPRMLSYKKDFQGNVVQNLRIGSTTFIDSPDNLKLSSNTYIGHFNFIEASNGILIEEGCQITSYVSIATHSSHISIRLYGSEYSNHKNHVGYLKGNVEIGAFTFVGPHVVIMPNTKIGKGCVVSAYSFVKGEYPDGSIIAGNPAKVVGHVSEYDEAYLKQHPELAKFYLR